MPMFLNLINNVNKQLSLKMDYLFVYTFEAD